MHPPDTSSSRDSNGKLPFWHNRGYLPHFETSRRLQMVTFHLADSLPRAVVQKLQAQSEMKSKAAFRKRVEGYIDAGYGACWLRAPNAATIMRDVLMKYHRIQYELHAYVIMPNHLHILVQALPTVQLSRSIQQWKTFSALRINKLVGRKGALWHPEYWDRYIRDAKHLRDAIDYILVNPVKAGLVARPQDWPWTWLNANYGGKNGREL